MPKLFLAAAVLLMLGTCAADAAAGPAAAYRLGAGDKVRISVYEWRSAVGEIHGWKALNADFLVGADGSVSLPLIGSVPAAGRSVEQLATAIEARLQRTIGLASRPHASVEVLKYRPFYILGNVNHPGAYPYQPGMTVLQAVSIAGGLFRADDPGLLALEKNSIVTAGDLQARQLQRDALLARRARLQAEVAGGAQIRYPRELLQRQHDPRVAAVMRQEQTIFASRREALSAETSALDRLKILLNDEVTSLQAKMKTVDEELQLLGNEVQSTTALVKRGLAAAPREFALRQTQLQTQGRRLDLDSAALRAREDIGKADQALIELRSKTRNAALAEMADIGDKLTQNDARIRTDAAIIEQQRGEPDPAGLFAQLSAPPVYEIVRITAGKPEEIGAGPASSVQPGDTVEVKHGRSNLTATQEAAGSGSSTDPPPSGARQGKERPLPEKPMNRH